MSAADKPVVFLHVPKTAGTSLIELLSRNFAADEVLRIREIHRDLTDISADIDVALAEGKRFICGHFPYTAVAHLGDEINIVTMLRDPIRRIVSMYNFWRAQPVGAVAGGASEFACRVARALSLEEFAACDHPLILSATRDEMCQALAGQIDQAGETGPAERFQAARESLAGMTFGLVEDMATSLRLLSRALRVNLLDQVHENTAVEPPAVATEAARDSILRHNLGDCLLYQHGVSMFRRKARLADMAELHREIGDQALTPMVSDAQGGRRWDAAMRLSGHDWNARETLADGSCFRFTSTPESVIYFPKPDHRRAVELTVEVAFFNRDGLIDRNGAVPVADRLLVEVNGVAAIARAEPLGESGAVFAAPIGEAASGDPFLTVVLRSPYGISPSVFGSPDRRILAAAVRSIHISA